VNRPDDKFCGGCAKALRAIPSVKKFDSTVPIEIGDVLSETPV
jgi:hypothetical protein